jgi:hypothetical protein
MENDSKEILKQLKLLRKQNKQILKNQILLLSALYDKCSMSTLRVLHTTLIDEVEATKLLVSGKSKAK